MHRKLRFFKEQILKAGISKPSEISSYPVDLDELEVPNFLNSFQISFMYSFIMYLEVHYSLFGD